MLLSSVFREVCKPLSCAVLLRTCSSHLVVEQCIDFNTATTQGFEHCPSVLSKAETVSFFLSK